MKSSNLVFGTLAYVPKNLPIGNTLSTGRHSSITIPDLRRFPAWRHSPWPVAIFVVIIIGAASAFVYVVLADDSGRTSP
jgi:hypothetical protein